MSINLQHSIKLSTYVHIKHLHTGWMSIPTLIFAFLDVGCDEVEAVKLQIMAISYILSAHRLVQLKSDSIKILQKQNKWLPASPPAHTQMKTYRMVCIWNDCYIHSLTLRFSGPAFQFGIYTNFY